MKVKLQKDYRRMYTIEELQQAKAVISAEKEDESTAASWAEYAAREALKHVSASLIEIIKVEATTAKNCRAWNLYGDETGCMDVWIDATAETSEGFLKFGAYLSDIWQTGAVDYRQHMYIKRYT